LEFCLERKLRRWPGLLLLRAFLRVVLEDALFLRGVFVVRLWWIRGGLWSIDDRSVAAKNMPTF
jgi:hypothetical protein